MNDEKYVHNCKCGVIHVFDFKKVDNAINKKRELILICGNCGNIVRIGADISPNYYKEKDSDPDTVYDIYTTNVNKLNLSFHMFDFKKKRINEILYNKGIRIPMMTGEYANSYFCGKFQDMIYPTFTELERNDITKEQVHNFIKDYNSKSCTVNMNRLINENNYDDIFAISKYYFEQFDWTGTEFDRNDEKQEIDTNKIIIESDECFTSRQFIIYHCEVLDPELVKELTLDEFETAYPDIWTYCLSDINEIKKEVVLVKFKDGIYRFVESE